MQADDVQTEPVEEEQVYDAVNVNGAKVQLELEDFTLANPRMDDVMVQLKENITAGDNNFESHEKLITCASYQVHCD